MDRGETLMSTRLAVTLVRPGWAALGCSQPDPAGGDRHGLHQTQTGARRVTTARICSPDATRAEALRCPLSGEDAQQNKTDLRVKALGLPAAPIRRSARASIRVTWRDRRLP